MQRYNIKTNREKYMNIRRELDCRKIDFGGIVVKEHVATCIQKLISFNIQNLRVTNRVGSVPISEKLIFFRRCPIY